MCAAQVDAILEQAGDALVHIAHFRPARALVQLAHVLVAEPQAQEQVGPLELAHNSIRRARLGIMIDDAHGCHGRASHQHCVRVLLLHRRAQGGDLFVRDDTLKQSAQRVMVASGRGALQFQGQSLEDAFQQMRRIDFVEFERKAFVDFAFFLQNIYF